ncbi:hypothetical protein M407DRAFT_18742, partial [Tulasnella calospora MUT 4182]
MADDQPGEPQDPFGNARKILSEIGSHRINPRTIKMTETAPHAEGGQGIIMIGTIIPHEDIETSIPEQLVGNVPEMKLAIKKLEWDRADVEETAKLFKSFVNELSIMATLHHPNIIML